MDPQDSKLRQRNARHKERVNSNVEYQFKGTRLVIGLVADPLGSAAIKTERLIKTIRELQQPLKKSSSPLARNIPCV